MARKKRGRGKKATPAQLKALRKARAAKKRKMGTTRRAAAPARRRTSARRAGYVVYEPGPSYSGGKKKRRKKAAVAAVPTPAPRKRRRSSGKRRTTATKRRRAMVPRRYVGRIVSVRRKNAEGKRRLVKRVYVRKNPNITGKGMTAGAVGLLFGLGLASFLDRYVATLPAKGTENPKNGYAVFGTSAIRAIVARPSMPRLATTGGGAVALGTVGYLLRKTPTASLFFWGAALGFAARFLTQSLEGWLMPAIFKADEAKGATDNESLGNHLYPDGQAWAYPDTKNPNALALAKAPANGNVRGLPPAPAAPNTQRRPQFAGVAAPPAAPQQPVSPEATPVAPKADPAWWTAKKAS